MTDREKGAVLQPEDTCPKTGHYVLDVLHPKHPKARPLTVQILEAYGGKPPAMVPVDITNAKLATIARQLPVSAGPGGVD